MTDSNRPGSREPGVDGPDTAAQSPVDGAGTGAARPDRRSHPRVSVVVLGFGSEPHLEACLSAVDAQLGPEDELILVDNGIRSERYAAGAIVLPHLSVIGDGRNSGFAGGCLRGAAAATGDVLVFVNSDAIVHPGAIPTLAAAVRDHPERGLVGGCLVLADDPESVNSVGNPLHFLGLTWAGHCGEPVSRHQQAGPVPVATGGLFGISRTRWDDLGGFDERYFAYHEDTDLSLRSWLAGWPVTFEPGAVAAHHYEFGRNSLKFYLLERNRMITVLTDYPDRLLRAVVPALLLVEPVLFLLAVRQGWGRQKLSAGWWIVRHRAELRERRRAVQSSVRVDAAEVAGLMVDRIDPPMVTPPPGMGVLNALLAGYWRLASRRLRRAATLAPAERDQVDDQTGERADAQA